MSIHDSKADGKEGHRSTSIDMPGAIETLKVMKQAGHELYLISFCGKDRAGKTADSINKLLPGLFTGLYFVRKPLHKKFVTAFLGCHVMIDDTFELLEDIMQQKACDRTIFFSGDPRFEKGRRSGDTAIETAVPGLFEASKWSQIPALCAEVTSDRKPDVSVKLNGKLYNRVATMDMDFLFGCFERLKALRGTTERNEVEATQLLREISVASLNGIGPCIREFLVGKGAPQIGTKRGEHKGEAKVKRVLRAEKRYGLTVLDALKTEHPQWRLSEITKEIKRMWTALAPDVQQPFKDLELADRERRKAELAARKKA